MNNGMSFQQLVDYGGKPLLKFYSNSISKALNAVYKGHQFSTWKFKYAAPDEYANPYNQVLVYSYTQSYFQRILLDKIASKLGIMKHEDWYSVSISNGPDFLILVKYYGESLFNILQSLYPGTKVLIVNDIEHEWKAYKFKRVPSTYWSIHSNRRGFLDDVCKELRLNTWEDWYRVSFYRAYIIYR